MQVGVSIIVAVYNVEKYLSKCLDSLIGQSFSDIEIICVDDGSEDNSLGVLKEYSQKDSRVKVFAQSNKGVAAARNCGLNAANGKYVLFVDADDWVKDDLCQKVYDIAQRNNSDIVMYNVAFYDNKTAKMLSGAFFNINAWKNHTDENTIHTYKDCKTIFYGNLSVANKLYRKSFLDKIGVKFPENTRFEDHSFHLETVFQAERINILDEKLYIYRQNRKNSMMSSLASTSVVFDIFKIVDIIEQMLKRIGEFEYLKYLFFQFKYEAFTHYYMKVNFFSKPRYYKIMKEKYYKMYEEDYDFSICKKMSNYFNFTDVLNYNWFVCYILKIILDNSKYKFRQKVEPVKKFMESGMDSEAAKYD